MEGELGLKDLADLPVSLQVGQPVPLLEVRVVLQLFHQLLHVEGSWQLPVDEASLLVPEEETYEP